MQMQAGAAVLTLSRAEDGFCSPCGQDPHPHTPPPLTAPGTGTDAASLAPHRTGQVSPGLGNSVLWPETL